MKIALASIDMAWENKELNLAICKELVKESSEKLADLVIFPEMTLTGFSMNVDLVSEDALNSESVLFFQNLATREATSLVFGYVSKSGNMGENRAVAIDKTGKILGSYKKIHPFSFSGENKYFGSGSKLFTFDLLNIQFGLSICYDLRFPELYSALSYECGVIINIANWPLKRIDHWQTLLKARAIENQIFIIGVNRTGKDGNYLDYPSSSNIIDPTGEFLFPYYDTGPLKIYEIDFKSISAIRNSFSTIQDRKLPLYLEFYKKILHTAKGKN